MVAAILLLFSILGTVNAEAAGPYLVTDNSQVTGETLSVSENTFNLEVTGQSETTIAKDEWFYVDIKNTPISIDKETGLIVLFGRWNNEGSPKATQVEGSVSEDGEDWVTLGYSYMQFRGGNGTIEYSKPIYGNENTIGKEFKRLRFKVLKTALGYANIDGKDYVRFNKFNVFLLKDGDFYPDGRIDPWRHKDDYYYNYNDYKFRSTSGILDARNHYGNNINYPTETPWGVNNTYTYNGREYELPTFHMQADNQMPHVTEHTVYVMPGEIIPLLPYYDMPRNGRYYAHFSHWYKYNIDIDGVPQKQDYSHVKDKETGERLLDFLVDPAGIAYTENVGYFGGNGLPVGSEKQFVIRTIDDLKEFSRIVEEEDATLNAILAADLDFQNGEVVYIGSSSKPYSGKFNGNGHSIKNIQIDENGNDPVGLFRNVASGAAIRNLKIENCNVRSQYSTGILIGEIAQYQDFYNNGGVCGIVEIKNVWIDGDIEITGYNERYSGFLIGKVGNFVSLDIQNVGCVGSILSNDEISALVGVAWTGESKVRFAFQNCYVNANINNCTSNYSSLIKAPYVPSENVSIENCIVQVPSIPAEDLCEILENNSVFQLWTSKSDLGFPIPPMKQVNANKLQTNLEDKEKFLSHPDESRGVTRAQKWYGTSATFFKPLDTSKAPDDEVNLRLGEHSFDIAADFSHEFDAASSHNLDDGDETIYSPIINFRHIFHVVSGKDFADSVTSSTDANKKYLIGKKRIVSAPAGNKQFVVRLPSEFPVPYKKLPNDNSNPELVDNIYSSTNFYYKSDATHYDRASGFDIEVYNKKGEKISDSRFEVNDSIRFDFEKTPKNIDYNYSQGTRQYFEDGPTYYTAGGEGVVYRMLECNNPKEGTYTVRIYALDDTGKALHIWNDENSRIYMMEYEITFLDNKSASIEIETSIPPKHRDSYLSDETVCGDPVVFLNFDEYRAFEDVENKDDYFQYKDDNHDHKSFKWPTIWSQCSYSFGYGEYLNYDYNEYLIANHVSQVPWAAAAGWSDIYDRLYYDTKDSGNPEKGYFYYVNAASDPGVTSRLRIDNLCMGSTVVVTGWVSDFSGTTLANVAFNFSAVLKNGTRQRLHSFVSGAVEGSAVWYHVYYSFVPVLPETINYSEIDHYELEVENNCQSSEGADYAVDDIRAYIVTPEITATQLAPVCDKDVKTTGVRLRTRFDKLLNSQGITEAKDGEKGHECTLYIAMFDKDIYDKAYADPNITPDEVLEMSLIKQLKNDDDSESVNWVGMTLSTQFTDLPLYDPNKADDKYYEIMRETSVKEVEYMLANIRPFDEDMRAGKQYYISTYLIDGDVANAQEPELADFTVSEDACAKYGTITLQGSGIIKVDGYAHAADESIEVCFGQSPVVQVELMMIDEDKKTTISEEKYYYDWYMGGLEEFSEIYQPLTKFRLMFPDATSIPTPDRKDPEFESMTDAEYDAAVKEFQTLAYNVEMGWLILHQSSYVFPKIMSSGEQLVVTAMPIVSDQKEEGKTVCAGPNEIRLKLKNSAPLMNDGFEKIPYPKEITDVPLRVGLRQLSDVCTQITALTNDFSRRLEVPLRAIKSYKSFLKDEATDAVMERIDDEETDPYIYLVESNDPHYKSLTSHPGPDIVDHLEGLIKPNNDYYGVMEGLLPVGMLTDMTAHSSKEDNYVNVVFSKDMKFREGYYYRLRFDFKEDLGEAEDSTVCTGQVVFTIKVVPEYQQWTGGASRNWNNDANWSRVAKADLFLSDTDTEIGSAKVAAADHTADKSGNNDNILSYAPLDFTKVIIPAGVDRFPVMFARNRQDVRTLHDTRKWDEKDSDEDTSNHAVTKDIKYDMASLSLDEVLACRPWYANTCEEIHFQSGAELLRQQYFIHEDNYQKAWADMEMEANRWYTLATPLQDVVAGDMYTISGGAKQNTELFKDITFNNTDYGRFEPAVYQRSWNKESVAEVYKFGDNTNDFTDAADGISLNWSRVYNQVDVNYSGGEGFSIITRYAGTDDDRSVRFRLPKADNMYQYFTPDDSTEKEDDKTLAERKNRHVLNVFPMTTILNAKADSKYFLVGNPFIARMDMKKFFEVNEESLSGKYWIMSDDRQMAYLWNGSGSKFITTSVEEGDTGEEVAPMQGFFVEAKEAGKSLTVKFTDDMIRVTDGEGSARPLKVRPFEEENSLVTVSAIVEGEVAARTVINLSAAAEAAYVEAEDAAVMIDPSLKAPAAVYTVADGKALAINSLDRIVETEIGVLASEDVKTTLLFEGVEAAEGVKLLDTAMGEISDLYDGMTYEVNGTAAGRLYLIDGEKDMAGCDLAVMLQGRKVTVVSTDEGVTARVYDTVGVCLGEWGSDECSLSFELPEGIMIVEASSGGKKVTRKFVVR